MGMMSSLQLREVLSLIPLAMFLPKILLRDFCVDVRQVLHTHDVSDCDLQYSDKAGIKSTEFRYIVYKNRYRVLFPEIWPINRISDMSESDKAKYRYVSLNQTSRE